MFTCQAEILWAFELRSEMKRKWSVFRCTANFEFKPQELAWPVDGWLQLFKGWMALSKG